MNVYRSALLTSMTATGALLAAAMPTLALETEPFMEKLEAAMEADHTALTYGQARVEGDSIVLSDVTFDITNGESYRFESMTFDGVSETDGGGYSVDQVRTPDIEIEREKVRVVVADITVDGLQIPATPSTDPSDLDGQLLYERAHMGPITVDHQEAQLLRADEFVMDIARKSETKGFDSMVRLEGIFLNLEAIEDPKARAALDTLGYSTLTGRASINASWDMEAGDIELSDYTIDLNEVGQMSILIGLSGYTTEMAAQFEEIGARMTEATEEADGQAMLALLEQLTLNSASIRFDDDGVTGKLLDYFGSQQGVGGEEMAMAVSGMLPLFLGRLQNPAFQQQVSTAVSAFLADPQSLAIRADPQEPLPLTTLFETGSTAPQTLPDVLDVTVSAND
ncbi:hypothetical protein [Pararhizobium haloflavum]|uniref:hypothetical protein n=1 Tax=Pararhizobium haloflavum TaxID=2037914 RepID=UPI000C183B07|nr:hypothetical protein [Pararhizobium haloflavum]